jgi:gliding motility-associated-like protein
MSKTMRQLFLTLFLTSSTFLKLYGQSVPCPFVNAGPDQTADCSSAQGCSNLTATFLDIRETSSYSIESIPHTLPIPYNQTGGTQVSANTDDVWSSIITLPFSFCYYGQTYTTCKIGSNGSILFNPTAGAGGQPWAFSASLTNTTGINGAGHVLGVYHDIDPSVCGTIKWYISGSAPCRQFIVSYDQICQFSCTTIKSRHMMVLNETTNYIDVYVESKPLCAGWNGGNAVIGLQNFAQNGGITAPNRNTAPDWTVTTPEGWRFKPAGTPLYSLEWFEGTTSLGTTPTISVCPSIQTTYTAQFTYTKCGSTTPTVLTDGVTITPAPSQITAVASPQQSTCGQPNGSVSITASGGSGTLTFSSDNVTFGSNNTFTGLTSGTYTFYVQDQGGCTVSLPVQITDLSTLVASLGNVTPALCNGSSDGTITLSASGGTQPYSYILGSGNPQSTPNFNNLAAGNYSYTVLDAQGCQVNITAAVTEPTALVVTPIGTTNSSCNLPNGSLEVSASGANAPYQYSIDNFTTNQSNGLFTNVLSGSYSVQVQDQNGCQQFISVVVNADDAITAVPGNILPPSCFGYSNGLLEAHTFGGPSPYQFSINGGSFGQDSVFTNLTAGSYLIAIQDANGCIDTMTMIVSQPTAVVANPGSPSTVCEGSPVILNGSASGGTGPYTLSWNGTGQNPLTIQPISSQTETFVVTDANGCTDTVQLQTTILPFPIADASASPTTGGVPLSVIISNQSQNANSYSWNFGNGETIQTTDLTSVNTNYPNDGTFIIELVASNGLCQDVWYDTIIVIPVLPLEVDVPNVFTPNADGNNEGYFVWTKNAASIEAVIVNRWGNTIVIIDDLNYKWDGKTSNGNEASEGVYFLKYKVVGLDGTEVTGHTFFHLIR